MTLHVDNIWHSYLVFFEKKKIKHAAKIKNFGSLPKPNRVSTFAEYHYHYSASTFDLYVCIQLFTHQKCYSHINSHFKQLKCFDSINVLIRSNYINKYIFKF